MWQPLNETVFVRPEEIEVSALIPEQYRKSHVDFMTGIVVAVGTGTLLDSGVRAPVQAIIGDRVLFGSKAGVEIKADGETLLLLAEANILAVERK